MSWKFFFFIILLLVAGVFFYLKMETQGSPTSQFNQTTRYQLARYPALRTLLGLHNFGDARSDYFEGSGPIYIVWFKPDTVDVDTTELTQFASLVTKYIGRPTQVIQGGSIGDGVVPLYTLNSARISAETQIPGGGTDFFIYFTQDFSPRADSQLSTTYLESGMAISLAAQTTFLSSEPQDMDNYLLSDMLHEFGNQIGLPEQTADASCVMDLHAGVNGQPLEDFGQATPQDYCPAEQQEIAQLKAEY